MSELSELSKINNIVTVDNYRYFITCGDEDFADPEKSPFLTELYKLFATFSLSIRFSLARELMTELGAYKDFATRISYKVIQRVTLDMLLNSFKNYQDIERKEYARLLKTAPSYVIDKLINNHSLPLDFLLNSSLLEFYKFDPMFQDLQREVQDVKVRRKTEIIAYCRGFVPDSKHMSDEMVLSVAGVNLGVNL